MPRFARILARLFAAVVLLQAVLAPAHCLALAAPPAGVDAVICSAEGLLRTIHIGPDGQEVPVHQAGTGFCPACHALPEAMLPAPPSAAAPAWTWTGAAWAGLPAEHLPPPARAPPFSPRAPPAFG